MAGIARNLYPFLLLITLCVSEYIEILTKLRKDEVDDISCMLGVCFVAEGCISTRNTTWRRVLEWPKKWKSEQTECMHAIMIRKNINPTIHEIFPEQILKELRKNGEEFIIVMASGGVQGPAREIRLETSKGIPLISVWHEDYRLYPRRKSSYGFNVISYDFQTINHEKFEAGLIVNIEFKNKKEYRVDNFCVLVHGSSSLQRFCGGLEEMFELIPSMNNKMNESDCDDDISTGFKNDNSTDGFFNCNLDEKFKDYTLKMSGKHPSIPYVKVHYALCVAGRTSYLVEDRHGLFLSLQYKQSKPSITNSSNLPDQNRSKQNKIIRRVVRCGNSPEYNSHGNMNNRCIVPTVPQETTKMCGTACAEALVEGNTEKNDGPATLTCQMSKKVVNGKIYIDKEAPTVVCDPTGWWRSHDRKDPSRIEWVDTIYCFHSDTSKAKQSECLLDEIKCSSIGVCPTNKLRTEVNCNDNDKNLVLAVFHDGYPFGFRTIEQLDCDKANRWWMVNGEALPANAEVACVLPMELEILRLDSSFPAVAEIPSNASRTLHKLGPAVRNSTIVVAFVCIIAISMGAALVYTRLEGPKMRMVTREIRSLYPSLLNDPEIKDKAKADIQYRLVDCEAAGVALHEAYTRISDEKENEFSTYLHTHWIKLSWTKRSILIERVFLHRAYFGLKILYDKYSTPDAAIEAFPPNLKDHMKKLAVKYKAMTKKWNSNDLLYSLAFASLTKAELDAFRKNSVVFKKIRPMPLKKTESIDSAPPSDCNNVEMPEDLPPCTDPSLTPLKNDPSSAPPSNHKQDDEMEEEKTASN